MQFSLILNIFNMFQVSLDIHYKEDEIYELSYKREPRSFIPAVRFWENIIKMNLLRIRALH